MVSQDLEKTVFQVMNMTIITQKERMVRKQGERISIIQNKKGLMIIGIIQIKEHTRDRSTQTVIVTVQEAMTGTKVEAHLNGTIDQTGMKMKNRAGDMNNDIINDHRLIRMIVNRDWERGIMKTRFLKNKV